MNNWPTKKLGEVCGIIKGKKPRLHKQKEVGMLPYLGARFMRGFKEAEHALISDKNSVPVSKKDLIIICDGSKSGDMFFGFEGILSSTMGKMEFSEKELEPKYLKSFLDLNFDLFNNAKKGAAIPHLDFNIFKNLAIPLPPLEIQKKIVKKIEELFAKITQAQFLCKSAIQDANNLIPSTLSKIFEEGKKKGWDINTLANICLTFTDGDWIESKDQSSDGIRLVQTGNIGNGGFLNKAGRSRFISVATFERLGCTEIFPNDLLISRLPNPVGRSCLIPETGQRMITAVDCTIVRIDTKGVNQKYVMYFTNSPDYFEQVSRLISGTTRDRISRKNLGTIKISLPPIAEQKEIVERMDALTQKVRQLQKLQSETATNLTALKQSILHKAFLGKL